MDVTILEQLTTTEPMVLLIITILGIIFVIYYSVQFLKFLFEKFFLFNEAIKELAKLFNSSFDDFKQVLKEQSLVLREQSNVGKEQIIASKEQALISEKAAAILGAILQTNTSILESSNKTQASISTLNENAEARIHRLSEAFYAQNEKLQLAVISELKPILEKLDRVDLKNGELKLITDEIKEKVQTILDSKLFQTSSSDDNPH